jgi:flagellin-like hook-associated protein FlgL
MGNVNTLSTGSISNNCPQNVAAQITFHNSPFQDNPIRDAGMAAEISRLIKSQILYQANAAVYAQAGALNPSALSFMRDSG